ERRRRIEDLAHGAQHALFVAAARLGDAGGEDDLRAARGDVAREEADVILGCRALDRAYQVIERTLRRRRAVRREPGVDPGDVDEADDRVAVLAFRRRAREVLADGDRDERLGLLGLLLRRRPVGPGRGGGHAAQQRAGVALRAAVRRGEGRGGLGAQQDLAG